MLWSENERLHEPPTRSPPHRTATEKPFAKIAGDMDRGSASGQNPLSRWREVLFAWFLVSVAAQAPYLKAYFDPPSGATFVGAFHWIDDVQNYLSFAEQAEEGHLLFTNKLYPQPHPAAMLGPEFLLTGWLARILGVDVFVAFRLVGLFGGLALVAGVDRLLAIAGLPPSHRLPGLLLVCLGGGFGGLLFVATDVPNARLLDLFLGFFPFMGFLANSHWTLAGALLVWSVLAWRKQSEGVPWVAIAAGTLLGLVRPYEPILLVGMLALANLRDRTQLKRVAMLALGLLPWLVYQLWLSLLVPAFAFFSRLAYPPYSLTDAALALGPACILALLSVHRPGDAEARRLRFQLLAWSLLSMSALFIRRPGAQSQILTGVGVPLLCLGAIGLSRWRARFTWLAAGLLSSSFVVMVSIVWKGDPHWFVPAEERRAVLALRPLCREGETVFAPPSLGLQVNALTRCRAHASHEVAPDYTAAASRVAAFYRPTTPEVRLRLLDEACARYVVLPAGGANMWLEPSSPFKESAIIGAGPRAIAIYARPDPPCASR